MRKKIKQDYEEQVSGPGKFEGEPAFVPYFYNLYLDGGGEFTDVDGVDVSLFSVGGEDCDMFPELDDVDEVCIWEDEQGFIYHKLTYKVRCNSCSASMINGVFCHEHGCPNSNLRFNQCDGEWDNFIVMG